MRNLVSYGTENKSGQREYWSGCSIETVSEIADVPLGHVQRFVKQAVEAHLNNEHGTAVLSPPQYSLAIEAAYGQGTEVTVTVKGVE